MRRRKSSSPVHASAAAINVSMESRAKSPSSRVNSEVTAPAVRSSHASRHLDDDYRHCRSIVDNHVMLGFGLPGVAIRQLDITGAPMRLAPMRGRRCSLFRLRVRETVNVSGKTTYRSALLEGNRYGHRSVGDGTEGRHFAVMVMHFGAWQGWGQCNNGGKERARRCWREARCSVSCSVQVCGVRK